MEQVIYGDILFVVNFSMDFLSLYITGRIGRARIRPAPLVLAASAGALYATAALFCNTRGVAGWVINIAVALLMCYIAFGVRGFAALLRQTALFYGVGFLLGGVMTAIYNVLQARFGSRNAVIDGDVSTLVSSIPLPYFIILALTAGLLSLVCGRLYAKRKSASDAELVIRVGQRSVRAQALCDSGNLLSEPLGGLPVVFLTREKAKELLPPSLAEVVVAGDVSAAASLPRETARRVRVIPMRGIGGRRMGVGFLPDELCVNGSEKNACVCCADESGYGGRDALLPSELL